MSTDARKRRTAAANNSDNSHQETWQQWLHCSKKLLINGPFTDASICGTCHAAERQARRCLRATKNRRRPAKHKQLGRHKDSTVQHRQNEEIGKTNSYRRQTGCMLLMQAQKNGWITKKKRQYYELELQM